MNTNQLFLVTGKALFLTFALGSIFASADAKPKKVQQKKIYHQGWIDFNKNGQKDVYEDQSRTIEERVEDLLSQMTLEEKSCQLTTLYGYGRVLKDSLPTERWKTEIWKDGIANIDEMLNGVEGAKKGLALSYPYDVHVNALHQVQRFFVEETRLGIPTEFTNEGIHGLNHPKATPLPAPIALGSTWDRQLIRQAGQIVGHEAKLIGYHSVYAPILDLARDPRWGRTLECYGEDPYHIGELGLQMSLGVQEQGVASCLKHYAAYSVPKGGRDGDARTDPHIAPRELHEIFMYPFKHVIMNAHPMEVMSSYNDWNGEPVTGSYYFLTELLRKTYGFNGYVVSDSDAAEFLVTKHHVSKTFEEGAARALNAGMNVRTNFQKPQTFALPVRNAYKQGLLSMETIDQRVREVLTNKFKMGLFDNPYTGDGALANAEAGCEHQLDFIDQVQSESMVLLKNADNLLPLDKNKVNKVLVAGPLASATNFMTSRYGPGELDCISMLDGLKNYLGADRVVYEKGCDVFDKNWPESEIIHEPLSAEEQDGINRAVAAAKDVDVIVACLGEDDMTTGEGRSRTSLDFPGRQQQLLEALYATGKPVILVMVNGQPLTINWANKYVPSILETWFPSYRGGAVVAKMLFGEITPSGKLPITFPKTIGEVEFNFPYKRGSHNGASWSWYVTKTRVNGALYPFGYGLSYTQFKYENLRVSSDMKLSSDLRTEGAKGTIEVSVDVTNTGACDGEEVVQLYVSDLVASLTTYESVLRGFERVALKKGETKTVHFSLKPEALQMLDKDMQWVVEPGEFEIRVGASSEDIKLKQIVDIK